MMTCYDEIGKNISNRIFVRGKRPKMIENIKKLVENRMK